MWSTWSNFGPKRTACCYFSHVKQTFDGTAHACFDRFKYRWLNKRQNSATVRKVYSPCLRLQIFIPLYLIYISFHWHEQKAINCLTSVKFSSFEKPNDAQVYLQETASTYLCKEWLQWQKFTILSKYTLSVSLYQPGMTLLEIICLIPSIQLSATDHKLNVVLPMVLRQIFVVKWKNCFSRRPLCKKFTFYESAVIFYWQRKKMRKTALRRAKTAMTKERQNLFKTIFNILPSTW